MASVVAPPKKALKDWARANSITPPELSQQAGISYQHAWNLLLGKHQITLHTLGKLLVVYGENGPALAIANAMRRQRDAKQKNGNGPAKE